MTGERTDIRSRALDLLRFPLALVILIVHVFDRNEIYLQGHHYAFDENSIVGIAINFVKAFLSGQSVPIYFFIAGYVFFLGFNLSMESYYRKMRNRFKSLFIPYILWNTLSIIIGLLPLLPVLKGFFPGIDHTAYSDFSVTTILQMYWNTGNSFPADVPLWFVRDLMIVAVTTPLINLLLKYFGGYLPIGLGIIWFLLPNDPAPELQHVEQLTNAYFFFSWGAYMSFNKKDMIVEFRKYRNISFLVYPLMSLLVLVSIYALGIGSEVMAGKITGNLFYIKKIGVLSGLLFAYNLAVVLIERRHLKLPSFLTSASFFIYASHMLLMPYVMKVLSLVLIPDTSLNALTVLVSTIIITALLLLGIYVFMRRIAPGILKPFAGGRL